MGVLMRLIEPGEPTRSRFLMRPLRYEAGGDYTHNGPRRWSSMDDPAVYPPQTPGRRSKNHSVASAPSAYPTTGSNLSTRTRVFACISR